MTNTADARKMKSLRKLWKFLGKPENKRLVSTMRRDRHDKTVPPARNKP